MKNNTNKDYGKLQLMMELVGRKDMREHLESRFSIQEQNEIFETFKGIMVDELNFVLYLKAKEKEHNSNKKLSYINVKTSGIH